MKQRGKKTGPFGANSHLILVLDLPVALLPLTEGRQMPPGAVATKPFKGGTTLPSEEPEVFSPKVLEHFWVAVVSCAGLRKIQVGWWQSLF